MYMSDDENRPSMPVKGKIYRHKPRYKNKNMQHNTEQNNRYANCLWNNPIND